MQKNEIKKAKNNELILEYVKSYSRLCLNCNCKGGTKRLDNHCKDLEKELVERGLLTKKDIENLSM